MNDIVYDCNLDVVIEMDERGVGVGEILQYARGALTLDEVRSLIYGLEQMVPKPATVGQI